MSPRDVLSCHVQTLLSLDEWLPCRYHATWRGLKFFTGIGWRELPACSMRPGRSLIECYIKVLDAWSCETGYIGNWSLHQR